MIYFLYLSILLITYFIVDFYINFAKTKNIVAIGNNKNSHEGVIPRGAGVVFGSIYIVLIIISYINHLLPLSFFVPIVCGSLFCIILGFFDDVYDLKAKYKFFFQNLIIFGLVVYFYFPSIYENFSSLFLTYLIMLTIFKVWMLNAFNFLDGTDGHLSCVSIMQGILMVIALYLNLNFELITPIILLLSVVSIFLLFNWPPAKVFMGDAGSMFIGINLIIFISISLQNSLLNVYLIFIIFSYYFVDTLGTFIIRTLQKKSWTSRHKSHPYQNFSRMFDHRTTLIITTIFHMLWLLPIVILAIYFENFQLHLTIVALIPLLIYLIKFGSLFSSE